MIQIYTGNNKGKTTAAIGQGIRACGNGFNVIMIQFLKTSSSGELNILKNINNFTVKRFEKTKGFVWNLNEEEKNNLKGEIREAYNYAVNIIKNNKCDMLILDEIMGVLYNKFLTVDEVINLLDYNKTNIEIILTGRDAPKRLIERADLVTEMKCIKHYYDKGVPARKGIEY